MDIVKTINEVKYHFKRLPVGESLVLQATLLKLAGPGLAGAKMMKGVGFLDQDIPSLIGAALSGLDPYQLADLIKGTVRKMVLVPAPVGVNGNDKTFDDYYDSAEKEAELLDVFYSCLEIQTGGTVAWIKKKLQARGSNS